MLDPFIRGLRHITVACTLMASCALSFAQPAPQLNLPRVTINAGMYNIQAQVASTTEQREIGLMNRKEMAANEGMLFVFEQPAGQCFWMKNTLLPLSAAFIGNDGTIINIEDMKPLTTNNHCSQAPVRYVLEMHEGWFKKHGFGPGKKLGGGPFGQ